MKLKGDEKVDLIFNIAKLIIKMFDNLILV